MRRSSKSRPMVSHVVRQYTINTAVRVYPLLRTFTPMYVEQPSGADVRVEPSRCHLHGQRRMRRHGVSVEGKLFKRSI